MKFICRYVLLHFVVFAWGSFALPTQSANAGQEQTAAQTQDVEQVAKIDLNVLYVGKPDTEREKEFVEFFGKHFSKVQKESIEGFDFAKSRDADVIMLDYQSAKIMEAPSFPDGYITPTLLTGWAGAMHHMSKGKGSYA
jgi:hypothetical protein